MKNSPPPCYVPEKPFDWEPTRQEASRDPRIHWRGDDGDNVFLEIQGDFAAVAIRKGPMQREPPHRKEIKGFSAAARLRMFKVLNRLDLDRSGRTTFATMTWRDDAGRPDPPTITRARSLFHRAWERIAKKHVAGIWRVEWQLRLTGEMKDEYMPHVHAILFDTPFIPAREAGRAWSAAIGVSGRVSLKLEELQNKRKALYYVSKYVAKQDGLSNLDIPSYLNSHLRGRKWGMYRKELLPWADKFEIRIPPGPLVDRLRAIAREAWPKLPEFEESGFTVFGGAAKLIQAEIDKWLLTQPEKPV